MTEQKYYDALTQQEVTEDFIKAQYEELTSKGDYFHDTYENFKNNNFKKIDTEAMSWEQQPKTVTLTNELCSTLQCYILMTTKHREGELKAWEELAQETDENGAPKFKSAASNAQFWRDMEPQEDLERTACIFQVEEYVPNMINGAVLQTARVMKKGNRGLEI